MSVYRLAVVSDRLNTRDRCSGSALAVRASCRMRSCRRRSVVTPRLRIWFWR
jgi:hypothetical protein